MIQLIVFTFLFSVNAYSTENSFYSDLKLILDTHEHAATLNDWNHSEYNVEHYFPKLINKVKSTKDNEEFCEALKELNNEDLVIFVTALKDLQVKGFDPCLMAILKETESFLKHEGLILTAQQEHMFFTTQANKTYVEDYLFGPSIEKHIDSTGGPFLVRADLPKKQINITFDDGPHSKLTTELLEILESENVQVNFFVQGKNVKAYPDIVKQAESLGHTIGNHSWNHPQMTKLSLNKAYTQIKNTFDEIHNVLGYNDWFFRFPYGSYNKLLKNMIKKNDVAHFFWNMDTLDWKIKNPKKLFEYALEQVHKNEGGIILFHDVQPQTIAMMPAFLKALKNLNYQPVVFRDTNR